GGQPGGQRVLRQLARGGHEGADRVGVVVPAGTGARRPADQPCLAATRPVEPHPGAALGVERQGGDQLGVGGDAPYEVQEFRLRGRRVVGRRGRGGGGVRGEDRH